MLTRASHFPLCSLVLLSLLGLQCPGSRVPTRPDAPAGSPPGPSASYATAHEMLERPLDAGPRILRPRPPELVTPLTAEGTQDAQLASAVSSGEMIRVGNSVSRPAGPGPTPAVPAKEGDPDPLEPGEELSLLLDRLRARPSHRTGAGDSMDRSSTGGVAMGRSSTGGGKSHHDRAWSGSVQLRPMVAAESQDPEHGALAPAPEEEYYDLHEQYEQQPAVKQAGYWDPYTGPRGVNGRPIAQPPPPRPGTRDHEFGQAPSKFRVALASIWGALTCAPGAGWA